MSFDLKYYCWFEAFLIYCVWFLSILYEVVFLWMIKWYGNICLCTLVYCNRYAGFRSIVWSLIRIAITAFVLLLLCPYLLLINISPWSFMMNMSSTKRNHNFGLMPISEDLFREIPWRCGLSRVIIRTTLERFLPVNIIANWKLNKCISYNISEAES